MSKKKKKLNISFKPYKPITETSLPPFMIGSTKAKFLGHNVKFDTYKDQQSVSDVRLTKDWGKLKFLEDNRDTDDADVKRLAESIKNNGQLQPIVINEKWEICEGQHRVKACILLDIPVLYVISEGATIKDTILMNNNQKSWKNRDYLKCFSHKNHKNHQEYRKVKKFFDDYNLNFSVTINLLSGNFVYHGGGNSNKAFKEGKFKIKNLHAAEKYGSQLKKIKAKVPLLVSNGKFCMAWVKTQNMIAPNSAGSWNVMTGVKQMSKNVDMFKTCNNQESWDLQLVEAYNKGLSKNNKIKVIRTIGA